MAKSARSSDKKRNNAKLRSKIFGPAQDARTARLSAKLQELASQPKPEQEKGMDVETDAEPSKDAESATLQDIDMIGLPTARTRTQKKTTTHRIGKNTRKKPRNQIVFPKNLAKLKRLEKNKKKST